MTEELRFADVAEGVRSAIAEYTLALDDGRTDDVVATFCADGSVDIPGLGAHSGHEAMRAAYDRVAPRAPQRHLVVNTHVTDWSAEEASAVSDFVFLLLGEEGWRTLVVGRYHDVLHHVDGRWRFHRRVGDFTSAPS